jgi:hypothetical protein
VVLLPVLVAVAFAAVLRCSLLLLSIAFAESYALPFERLGHTEKSELPRVDSLSPFIVIDAMFACIFCHSISKWMTQRKQPSRIPARMVDEVNSGDTMAQE